MPLPGIASEPQGINSVAVIIPVFNERVSIGASVDAVAAFAAENPRYYFLFVDDGSGDGTGETLRTLIKGLKGLRIASLHFARNRGKGAAVRAGFAGVEADALCFIDGDLAYSLDHLSRMEAALQDSDVVIGSRKLAGKLVRSSLRRHILGEGFNRLARLLLGLPFQDTQAGVKGFRLHAARRLFEKSGITGFGCDVEILFLARKYGMRIAEVPAYVSDAHPYKKGKLRLLKDSLVMFSDLMRIRLKDLAGRYD